MVAASVVFLVALLAGHDDWQRGDIESGPFLLTVGGFVPLTVGGWLGGTIVSTHGTRVLGLVDEPATRAASPEATPEKETAEVG
jgi:hypothetical protein